jgi:hypothetical protein
MNRQYGRTLQDTVTTLAPADVLAAAKRFFTRHGIYVAFLEKEGPTYVNLRGQGGEELVVGVAPTRGARGVTGFDLPVRHAGGAVPRLAAAGDRGRAPSSPRRSTPSPPTRRASRRRTRRRRGARRTGRRPPRPAAGGARPGGSPA